MATTTTAALVAAVHPDETPAVVKARKALDEALGQEAALADRMRRLTAILDPYQEFAAPVSADDRLDAIEHFADVRVDHAKASRARLVAESAWLAARDAARDAARAGFREQKVGLVRRLDALLQPATVVSRQLAQIEDTERAATGDWFASGYSWSELAEPSPLQGSKFADWRQAATDAGLLGVSK